MRWGKNYTPEYNYVEEFYRVPTDQYDRLLSESIIFLDMHETRRFAKIAHEYIIETITKDE